ncbi:hypothetical protein TrLO_g15693 [Triparma laevis f. longispina]|uniref:Uncharacterized protein n=1 Tax=Triparma laevis f. longispina TaxID=1714387 RepID=A0A9W7FIL7_9STRA|nr:hypothetical protein TrLO_g15693 [Triparma laevis f. longispina]
MDVWKAHNLRLMFLSAVAGLLRTIEGISRFTTGIYVGETFLTTFLAAWAGFLFWGQLGPIFLEQVLNIIIKSMKMSGPEGEVMTKKMETMRVLMLWQIPQVMVAYLSLFATAFIENPFIAQWLVGAYYFFSTITSIVGAYYFFSTITSIFFVFFIALPTMGAFLKIIKDANPDGTDAKLNGLENKIGIFYRETRNNGVSNTVTCIIFCIPLTQTLVTYQVAFGWTIGALITGTAIWFIAPRAKNAKRVTPSTTKSTVVEN